MCVKEHMRIKRLYEMRSKKIIEMSLTYKDFIYTLAFISTIDSNERDKISRYKEEQDKISDLIHLARTTIATIDGKYLLEKTDKRGKEFGELLMQERIRDLNKRRKMV